MLHHTVRKKSDVLFCELSFVRLGDLKKGFDVCHARFPSPALSITKRHQFTANGRTLMQSVTYCNSALDHGRTSFCDLLET
jgi:hypothetical protein